ncbi:hypothetical protein B0T10DRAFT_515625 [Thelonectria olida]|uniref:Uncharacterized protein n=1 Tax=Thelonectria olida TaxID=1576542 RepID=A0A9P8W059_9HYPO|nr:hypothetical protein B0T10DRAFT_515625 [Thelonectria olida]
MAINTFSSKRPSRRSKDEDVVETPLTEDNELLSLGSVVPGQPLIHLDDQAAVGNFLLRELSTERLNRIYGLLFLASNRGNISALHHQRFKTREICITEQPDLHLVWYYERIFIKPIPKCLFSHHFWKTYINQASHPDGADLCGEAYGFLRSYSHLIVHESDFDLARDLRLVPEMVTWEKWCHFIRGFQHLRDRDVAPRYHYGEIRLTRLNFWTTLLHGRSYCRVYHNYAVYFARFGAPYLFVFGAITLLLTAMQTGLATFDDGGIYRDMSARFVPFTLVLALAGLALLPLLFAFFQLKELFWFVYCHRELS